MRPNTESIIKNLQAERKANTPENPPKILFIHYPAL